MKQGLIILLLAIIMNNIKSTNIEIKTEEEISLEKEGEELTKKLEKVRKDKEIIIKASKQKDDALEKERAEKEQALETVEKEKEEKEKFKNYLENIGIDPDKI